MNPRIFSLALVAALAGSSLATSPVTMAWARAYSLHGQAEGIALDASGNVYTVQDASVGANVLWSVQKFDPYGVLGWNQANYFLNSSQAYGLKTDSAGNTDVFGSAANTPTDSDAIVYKLDKTGALAWFNQLSGADKNFDACLDVTPAANGGVFALTEATLGGSLWSEVFAISNLGSAGFGQAGVQMTGIRDVVGPASNFALTGLASNGGMFAELTQPGNWSFKEVEPTTIVGGVTTSYSYKTGFDPAGLLYVFKSKAVVTLLSETDTYTIRAFDTGGNVVWSAGPFDDTLTGDVQVPRANKAYYTATSGGVQTVYLRSQAGLTWSKPHANSGILVADDTSGVFFISSSGGGLKIEHLNEKDGSLDWTTAYTPPQSASILGLHTAVKGGALHIFGTYNHLLTGTRDDFTVKFIQGIGPTSVTLTSPSITGSQVIGGTVKISAPAPAGGFTVNLSSSDAGNVGVPAQVVVPKGMSSVSFNCVCDAVDTKQPVNIIAKAAGCMRASTVTLNPNPLSGFTPASPSVVGGAVFSAKVNLAGPAGNSGRFVYLNSIDPAVASVPHSLYIAPGTTSASFQVTTHAVAIDTVMQITATSGGVVKTMALTVKH